MDPIKLKLDPPVAWITLNRPENRNALSPDLTAGLLQALREMAANDEIAAVIITAEGPAFCAGADLKVFRAVTTLSAEEARKDSRRLLEFFQTIYEYPKPTIAAVQGPALAGGCGLVTVCDIVIAAEEATFGFTEVRLGVVPALVTAFLVRLCGERKARELLLTARVLSAAEAREIGLVNQVVPGTELIQKAGEAARQMARNSPAAMELTKGLLRDLYGLSLREALLSSLQVSAFSRTTDDFREGVSSFLEKRQPRWKRK